MRRTLRDLFGIFGAGGRTRTDDLLITNQLLYKLSYAGRREGPPQGGHYEENPSPVRLEPDTRSTKDRW